MGAGLSSCDYEQDMPPVTYPEGGSQEEIGTGSWDNPYYIWQVRAGVDMENINFGYGWVHGYIVGYIDTSKGSKFNATTAVFGKAGSVGSNLLLAQTPDETDWEKCIPVNFEYDTPARDALNLAYNPGVMFREVCLYGITGYKYRTVYGLRNCSQYKFGALGDESVVPPVEIPSIDEDDAE